MFNRPRYDEFIRRVFSLYDRVYPGGKGLMEELGLTWENTDYGLMIDIEEAFK